MLTKRGTYLIHAIIPTKYQKYPSTTILKHVIYLAKVNKSPGGILYNITPHDAYSITIHMHTTTLEDINH